MNNTCNTIREILIDTSVFTIDMKYIPSGKKKPPKMVKTYNYVKIINKIIFQFRSTLINLHFWPNENKWKYDKEKLNEIAKKFKLPTFSGSDYIALKEDAHRIKHQLQDMARCLQKKASFEQEKFKKNTIKKAVNNRCKQFKSDLKKMINSILDKEKKIYCHR